MKKHAILLLFLLPAAVSGAPAKKIEACVANGGIWNGRACDYPSPEELCLSDGGVWQNGACSDSTEQEACIADGGVWTEAGCQYPDLADECTPATQFIDCPSGTTSASGPGVCVLGEHGYYQCEYLYQQSCSADSDCDAVLGVESSVYVCCQRGTSMSSCMNPFLCR